MGPIAPPPITAIPRAGSTMPRAVVFPGRSLSVSPVSFGRERSPQQMAVTPHGCRQGSPTAASVSSRSQRLFGCGSPIRAACGSLAPTSPMAASQTAAQLTLGPTPGGPPRPLAEGEVATIGRRNFLLGKVLGQGAYAIVWSARVHTPEGLGEEVAIKEMKCGKGPGILPDASLQRANYEVEVMLKVSIAAGDKGCFGDSAVPRVLEQQYWPLGPAVPDGYVYRVAMERKPGIPLVDFLEARIARAQEELARSPGSSPENADISRYIQSFVDAAAAARALLVQLCPTFARLNGGIAYHRDVNARNLLVHAPSEGSNNDLGFSLLDFGLSVDYTAWHGGGEGSWQTENPSGDARYWGPASWLRFFGGVQALQNDAELERQYAHRLDMYALGVCALEVMSKLHTVSAPSEAVLRSLPADRSTEVHLVHSIEQLRSTWSAYWQHAVSSFERLAEYSRAVCLNDKRVATQRWQELSTSGIGTSCLSQLHAVCDDLSSMAEVCLMQRSSCSWGEIGDTVDSMRSMVHEAGMMEWSEISRFLARYERRQQKQKSHTQPSQPIPASPTATSPVPPMPLYRNSTRSMPSLASPSQSDRGVMEAPVGEVRVTVATVAKSGGEAAAERLSTFVERATSSGQATVIASSPTHGVSDSSTKIADEDAVLEAPMLGRPSTPPGQGALGTPRMRKTRFGQEVMDGRRLAEHEALRILRQVESEVRSLKQWYAEAVEAHTKASAEVATTLAAAEGA
mmetsp:Transcript_50186/g.144635  ORF Transcript_50186/g.144635 Transcript_50186/m.144635 type:complete len:741 (+) Transcript_50186:137-2359(+)